MEPGVALLSEMVGRRVRGERKAREWTLDRLAEETGVSRRLLVSVEQGEANPSVGTLLRISEALGVSLSRLVEASDATPVKVTRRGAGVVLWSTEAGGQGVLVSLTEGPNIVELWDWTLAPNDRHASGSHAPGTRELVQVRQGSITVEVGSESIRLGVGDAATFPGDVVHAYVNDRARAARFTLVVFEPGTAGRLPVGVRDA